MILQKKDDLDDLVDNRNDYQLLQGEEEEEKEKGNKDAHSLSCLINL